MEKKKKNCHFFGRIWPYWGNITWTDMAGLGSTGLTHISHLKVTEIFLIGVDTYGGNMGYLLCSCLKALINLVTAYYQS